MTISKPIVSLCFETTPDFEHNLSRLETLIDQCDDDAIIVAPEVALSGFAYERFEEAATFTPIALEKLLKRIGNRLLIFTAITERGNHFFNIAYAIHNGKLLHTQGKSHLFTLGNEHTHFAPASPDDIVSFDFEGIRIGILICFELRFKPLWQALEGCDIIAIPAQWGKLREEHFRILTESLAIMNQCYVIASDADNSDTTALSGIITPFGNPLRNNGSALLSSRFEQRTVQSMRRYLNVGIE